MGGFVADLGGGDFGFSTFPAEGGTFGGEELGGVAEVKLNWMSWELKEGGVTGGGEVGGVHPGTGVLALQRNRKLFSACCFSKHFYEIIEVPIIESCKK